MTRPTPIPLRRLLGNPGHRPLPERELRPLDASAPDPPRHLSAGARAEWRQVVPELHRMGVIARLDGTLLAMYAEAVARWRAAERIVAADGMLLTTQQGNRIQHPAVGVANVARRDAVRIMGELGLTPAARAKMEAVATNEDEVDRKYFPR